MASVTGAVWRVGVVRLPQSRAPVKGYDVDFRRISSDRGGSECGRPWRVSRSAANIVFGRKWPVRKLRSAELLLCKTVPEPHFAGRKSLL